MKPKPYMIDEDNYGFSKTCMHCSETTDFIIKKDEYVRWILNDEYIQDVFSYLDKEEREMMISGTHPRCWEEMFADIDEDLDEEDFQ